MKSTGFFFYYRTVPAETRIRKTERFTALTTGFSFGTPRIARSFNASGLVVYTRFFFLIFFFSFWFFIIFIVIIKSTGDHGETGVTDLRARNTRGTGRRATE